MKIIGDLYYLVALFIVVINISIIPSLYSILNTEEWMTTFQKVNNRFPTKTEFKDGKMDKMSLYYYLSIFTVLWMMIGLVTKSWFIYLTLLVFNFFMSRIIEQIGLHKKISKFLRIFIYTIDTIFLLFLVLNHFHLHFQILELFK